MSKSVKRYLSVLCALALAATLLPSVAIALDVSVETRSDIGRGLTVTEYKRKSDISARQMFVLDYTPGGAVTPIVAYGDKLYGKSDINYAVSYAQARGMTVLAAVNADFFNVDTGVPTGMLINNGRLCVSDGAWNAVGFLSDGTALSGAPSLSMSYYRHKTGVTQNIHALNKVRTTAGIYLYSEDFSATTRTVAAGVEVVLECAPGDYLRLGQPLNLTVVAINYTPGTAIGSNQFVLSLTDANTTGLSLLDIAVGETITVSANTPDTRWHDAVYACGGGNMLAVNGALTSSATASTLSEPRTVLGVRADGSVSVLVCDGRQKGLSDGISLQEAAQILLNRGCKDIVNLDGGGSTAVSLRKAGQPLVSLSSSPSDGSPRKCANYILFVNSGNPSLPANNVSVYPQRAAVLAGAALTLSGLSYNDDYFPSGEYYGGYTVTTGGGYVDGNTFYAPEYPGVSTVDAASYMLSAGASIETVTAPAELYFAIEGSRAKLTTLGVATDSVTDLSMYASDGLNRIVSQDTQFMFSVSGNIGQIDENGVFTAVSTPGLDGAITAQWGGYTLTLPVTVGRAPDLVENFESVAEYEVTTTLEGSSALARVLTSPENARYGKGVLSLSYTAVPAADGVYETTHFTGTKTYPITGGANIVSMMARGSGDFGVDFQTPSGIQRVPFALTEDWQYITVNVPVGATAVAGFSASGEFSLSGYAFIDQMMFHYGVAANDTTPPEIVNMQFDGVYFTAEVMDNYPLPVTASMLRLTVDGTAYPFEYEPITGTVTAIFDTLAEGKHRVTLSVRDYFYNVTRQTLIFGETEDRVFTDLEGHWGMEYIEYLRERGVFSPDTRFNPQSKVSNEMAATIISRFLGADTSKYDTLEMPYTDAAQISDWAAPHVKAMYYMGVMIGGANAEGKHVFNPQAQSTRAQIMTVLGRTIERGYQYSKAPFDDYGSIPSWAADHISLLYALGIVNGYTGTNNIVPSGQITRAEMASLLFKLY